MSSSWIRKRGQAENAVQGKEAPSKRRIVQNGAEAADVSVISESSNTSTAKSFRANDDPVTLWHILFGTWSVVIIVFFAFFHDPSVPLSVSLERAQQQVADTLTRAWSRLSPNELEAELKYDDSVMCDVNSTLAWQRPWTRTISPLSTLGSGFCIQSSPFQRVQTTI